MAKYVPSPRDWVREQVELYESSGGTEGTTLRDTGLPVISELAESYSSIGESVSRPRSGTGTVCWGRIETRLRRPSRRFDRLSCLFDCLIEPDLISGRNA
jgi:hypothetical protein